MRSVMGWMDQLPQASARGQQACYNGNMCESYNIIPLLCNILWPSAPHLCRMKSLIKLFLLGLMLAVNPLPSFCGDGPVNPGSPGSGVFRFGAGAAIPFYGCSGSGAVAVDNYDQNIWQAGPGTISLGGQIGVSFFSRDYTTDNHLYKYRWSNIVVIVRGAYHYGWGLPGFDTYAGIGAGPLLCMFDNDGYDNGQKSSHLTILPAAFAGVTYFFNNIIGINAECGYNLAYVSAGITFRLTK